MRKLDWGIIITILSAIITVAFVAGQYTQRIHVLEDDLKSLSEEKAAIEESITATKEAMASLDGTVSSLTQQISDLKTSTENLQSTLLSFIVNGRIAPSSSFMSLISMTYAEIDAPCTSAPIQLSTSSVIAYEAENPKNEFTLTQLANLPLLLPYIEDGKTVIFYGQLNDSGNWDGRCIVNIYENGILSLITDAQYDNGSLLQCKQAFPDFTTTEKVPIWVISERVRNDGYSSGESWHYFRSGNCTMNFKFDDVTAHDVMSVDQFAEEYCTSIEGYYCGHTSNGRYNDNTGTACMVKYFADGTVKTLYVGKIENGQLHDQSGNAWMIGKRELWQTYSYYKGPFINGNSLQEESLWKKQLTDMDIKLLVDESKFNCTLKWSHETI